jgi:hypothetical protein
MNKNMKIWLFIVVAAVLAIAALAAFWAAYTINQPRVVSVGGSPPFPFRTMQIRINTGDIELFYIARTVFSTINIALLIALITTYASIYAKTRSQFTVGLLIFATFFLIKDITWSPFVIGAFGFGLFGLGPFAFLPDLFELAALSVLLYLTVKY